MHKVKKGDKFTAKKASFNQVTWIVKAVNDRLKKVICTSSDIELPSREFTFDELAKLHKL